MGVTPPLLDRRGSDPPTCLHITPWSRDPKVDHLAPNRPSSNGARGVGGCVLPAPGGNGNSVIIDDFREAYHWLRDNTPANARVMAWWDHRHPPASQPILLAELWSRTERTPKLSYCFERTLAPARIDLLMQMKTGSQVTPSPKQDSLFTRLHIC